MTVVKGQARKFINVNRSPLKQKKTLDSIREKISALGMTEEDIDESVKWARSK